MLRWERLRGGLMIRITIPDGETVNGEQFVECGDITIERWNRGLQAWEKVGLVTSLELTANSAEAKARLNVRMIPEDWAIRAADELTEEQREDAVAYEADYQAGQREIEEDNE